MLACLSACLPACSLFVSVWLLSACLPACLFHLLQRPWIFFSVLPPSGSVASTFVDRLVGTPRKLKLVRVGWGEGALISMATPHWLLPELGTWWALPAVVGDITEDSRESWQWAQLNPPHRSAVSTHTKDCAQNQQPSVALAPCSSTPTFRVASTLLPPTPTDEVSLETCSASNRKTLTFSRSLQGCLQGLLQP